MADSEQVAPKLFAVCNLVAMKNCILLQIALTQFNRRRRRLQASKAFMMCAQLCGWEVREQANTRPALCSC